MKKLIQQTLKKRGKQIIEYPTAVERRHAQIIRKQEIDTLLDIGANSGQYGGWMRKELGFAKKIISFEPMSAAFDKLKKNAANDPLWQVKNYALGDFNGKTKINVSSNSYSSSILNMLPSHEEGAPESKYIQQEEIEVKKVDDIFEEICGEGSKIMMKIDTQGFEKQVLDGASECLDKISIIELEMSLVPLYENGVLYKEMIDFMEGKGFTLFLLAEVFSNPKTGQLLQVDGVFVKQDQ